MKSSQQRQASRLRPLALHKESGESLVAQIENHFRSAIESGELRSGDRLPTIRDIASETGVTRTTVQQAYRKLATEGLVEATVGRGTLVRGDGTASDSTGGPPLSPAAHAAFAHLQRSTRLTPAAVSADPINFADLLPSEDLFPTTEFRAALDAVLAQDGGRLLAYGEPAGNQALRSLVAARHGGGASAADPARVMITSGAQQGIDLVLRTFAIAGDAVAVAIPTYHQLFGVLQAQGLGLVPIPTRPVGGGSRLDLEVVERVLSRPEVRLLYVMPTFHNPTGETMTLAEREDLMAVVGQTRIPVLEDEFECELRFDGGTVPTLAELDPRRLTVTVRSFSKGLFPGVRIGWVEADPAVLGPMAALKQYSDLETSPLLQAGLLEFIQRGALDRYLGVLRGQLADRHARMQRALADHMPAGTQWTKPGGGLALWVELPAGILAESVAELAARRGVRVTPGSVFDPTGGSARGLRLSVARVDSDRLERGIEILAECTLQVQRGAVDRLSSPLFL